ncbi:Hsp20 family protein [Caulobacter sp. S45]|uniref:Hsp20 family protein n=1 Tax=Caulobacter sp. S45 TaxID=1641861 RepID=UPI00131B6EBE|nr:Hsp20 family protein [Caulobacter sp. S45]
MRTAYDLSPLYRSMIGVDRMADLIDAAMRSEGDSNYPPYDIEKTGEDSYRVTLAAAGFSAAELEITAQPNLLIVAGRKAKADDGRTFLHRGIAGRNFERRFELADYVVVKSADYADGVLSISLAREVPEALKPRRIGIQSGDAAGNVPRLEEPQAERRAA